MSVEEFREWERRIDARIRPWLIASAIIGAAVLGFVYGLIAGRMP
jgi:hypothetical protein